MAFRNQRLKERYYDRVRRKVCVVCENKILFTSRRCINCHEKDLEYDKKVREKKGNQKVYHSNRLADKYGCYGIVKDKKENAIEDEI